MHHIALKINTRKNKANIQALESGFVTMSVFLWEEAPKFVCQTFQKQFTLFFVYLIVQPGT